MIKQVTDKIRGGYKLVFNNTLLFFATKGRRKHNPRSVLIIKSEQIGDYILFRNCLPWYRSIPEYKDHSFTLCGNNAFESLAQQFDTQHVNGFVWFNRTKFLSSMRYKYRIMRTIYKEGFEVVINTNYSRHPQLDDLLSFATGAAQKIAMKANFTHRKKWQTWLYDKHYTRMIDLPVQNIFEFDRNIKFIETLCQRALSISLHIEKEKLPSTPVAEKGFIIIFPSSSEPVKIWDIQNFIGIGKYCAETKKKNIVLAGHGKTDETLNNKLKAALPQFIQEDYTNRLSLTELCKLVSQADLVLTNDTAILHIGAAQNIPTVGLYTGTHFARFGPYDRKRFPHVICIYPKQINQRVYTQTAELAKQIEQASPYPINDINYNDVVSAIDELIPT
jgi:ADP-heptose:LPS heptosyltransferase